MRGCGFGHRKVQQLFSRHGWRDDETGEALNVPLQSVVDTYQLAGLALLSGNLGGGAGVQRGCGSGRGNVESIHDELYGAL